MATARSFIRTEATNVPLLRPNKNLFPLESNSSRACGVISASVTSRIQICGVKLQLRTGGKYKNVRASELARLVIRKLHTMFLWRRLMSGKV